MKIIFGLLIIVFGLVALGSWLNGLVDEVEYSDDVDCWFGDRDNE